MSPAFEAQGQRPVRRSGSRSPTPSNGQAQGQRPPQMVRPTVNDPVKRSGRPRQTVRPKVTAPIKPGVTSLSAQRSTEVRKRTVDRLWTWGHHSENRGIIRRGKTGRQLDSRRRGLPAVQKRRFPGRATEEWRPDLVTPNVWAGVGGKPITLRSVAFDKTGDGGDEQC